MKSCNSNGRGHEYKKEIFDFNFIFKIIEIWKICTNSTIFGQFVLIFNILFCKESKFQNRSFLNSCKNLFRHKSPKFSFMQMTPISILCVSKNQVFQALLIYGLSMFLSISVIVFQQSLFFKAVLSFFCSHNVQRSKTTNSVDKTVTCGLS